jgi:two-component system, LytTR family, sensor kinase
LKTTLLHFLRQYKIHLICWAVFILYEVSVIGALMGSFASFGDYLLHYAINIGLFYLHALVALPFALQHGKLRYWLLPILVAAEIAAYAIAIVVAEFLYVNYMDGQLVRPFELDYAYWLRMVWRAIYFMIFATGYYLIKRFLEEKKRAELSEKQSLLNVIENQRLQSDLVRSQNAFLKAQINPHFLFNTLSFVYNSVRKTSTPAAEAIMALSQMMRYALQSENEYEESELLEEIEHANNLIQLHQIRHEHQLQLQFSYGDNLAGVRIIPLVLITLVENVFQHAELTRPNHVAKINVRLEEGTLHITTSNLKNSGQPAGHRIGLDNIQRRLQHAYKDKAHFEATTDEHGYFVVAIRIADMAMPAPVYSEAYLAQV